MTSNSSIGYAMAFALITIACRIGWDTWAVAITTGATRLCVESSRPVFPEAGVLGDIVEFEAPRGQCFELIRVHGVSFDISEAVNYAEIRTPKGRFEIEALSTDSYAIEWSRVARNGVYPILVRVAMILGVLGGARWCVVRARIQK